VDAVALAAGQFADLALLIGPLEVELRDVAARGDAALAGLVASDKAILAFPPHANYP